MQTPEQLIETLIEKRSQLNELKAQSSEIADAITLAEEYHALYLELLDRYKQVVPTIVPMPYPVYPSPTLPPYRIISAPSTYVSDHTTNGTQIISGSLL